MRANIYARDPAIRRASHSRYDLAVDLTEDDVIGQTTGSLRRDDSVPQSYPTASKRARMKTIIAIIFLLYVYARLRADVEPADVQRSGSVLHSTAQGSAAPELPADTVSAPAPLVAIETEGPSESATAAVRSHDRKGVQKKTRSHDASSRGTSGDQGADHGGDTSPEDERELTLEKYRELERGL